jgi:hypothetical protein
VPPPLDCPSSAPSGRCRCPRRWQWRHPSRQRRRAGEGTYGFASGRGRKVSAGLGDLQRRAAVGSAEVWRPAMVYGGGGVPVAAAA